ncbi:MAG TPA: pyrophosphohydrolase [Dehalococcoidia bacterium]|jgi:NTP pyrophosphatase (non-canonical NTP hydrolase)|nr:pyrophosphohydrolase [Dehalococcoidia bacterium]
MEIRQLQDIMLRTYGDCDAERGIPATIAWLTEEVGELAKATRKGTKTEQLHEAGDVLAWLASLANQLDIDLAESVSRFADGCPHCHQVPCNC